MVRGRRVGTGWGVEDAFLEFLVAESPRGLLVLDVLLLSLGAAEDGANCVHRQAATAHQPKLLAE